MKLKNKMTALGVSIILAVGGTAGIANADTTNIWGTLHPEGYLVKYDKTRIHTFNGPITLNVTDMPSGYLRLGLRDMARRGGPQFTATKQWNKTGSQYWPNIAKGQKFAIQGRMKPAGPDWKWGGRLTY